MKFKKVHKINPKTGVCDKRMIMYFKVILNALLSLPHKERIRIYHAIGAIIK